MSSPFARRDFVLAVLASAGDASFEPVHVQKLFSLLDERVSSDLGGRYFAFRAYDYGPFDREVYDELSALRSDGYVLVDQDWRGLRRYHLTPNGTERGHALLESLSPDVQAETRKYSNWVVQQTFAALVSAVYKAYPAMRANSVFVEP